MSIMMARPRWHGHATRLCRLNRRGRPVAIYWGSVTQCLAFHRRGRPAQRHGTGRRWIEDIAEPAWLLKKPGRLPRAAVRTIGHCLVLVSLLMPASALAQAPTPVTATDGIAFTSAGHTLLKLDGTSVVTRYELRFIPGSGCTPIPVANLGKPALNATGEVVVKPLAAFGTLPVNCAYTATIAAIGPDGEGVSVPTDPFARLAPQVPPAPGKPVVR